MNEEQNSPVIFSEWVKRRRKTLDLTQEELAQRAGCSVFALRKIESGERRPSKQLAALLARALAVSSEDEQAFVRIARGELNPERLQPSLAKAPVPFSELKPAGPPCNIPSTPTPLIGREPELAAMQRLFNDPQCRLLTLTGIGGIGKTRLSIEFASRQIVAFPGGVFYIPLTAVNSAEGIAPAIAEGLGFRFSGPAAPQEQLIHYLASASQDGMLLVLDNLEQLLTQLPGEEDAPPGVVQVISQFLQRLPGIKILGTSRERLNIQEEWLYELHGLPTPPSDFVGQVETYNATALFIKCAQRVNSNFALPAGEQAAVVRICRLVEGIPLAIELAAAWTGMLSCAEIAQEISANLDFLTTSMRDMPARHRSLRATFDHSWKLLSDSERQVLCQLAIFHGGFERQAADQISKASLPLLASLAAKSLVYRSESGRYDLHEVIRQYAQSHLQEDPSYQDTYQRHCEYYLTFARQHTQLLKTAAQQEIVRQLTVEIDNLYAAWIWAVEHGQFALLEQAVRCAGWYFEIVGWYREGIESLGMFAEALKTQAADGQWTRAMGLTLLHQALLYFRSGKFSQALAHYEESIVLLRQTGDKVLLADALIFRGTILHLNGEYPRAIASINEGLAYAQQYNQPWFEAYAIYNLGYIVGLMGDNARGYEQMQVALRMWRSLGDPHAIALGLNFIVPLLIKLGRYEEAKTCMWESIDLCEQTKNRWGKGTACRFLGLAYLAQGQYQDALAHLQKSLELFNEYAEGWDIARTLTYMGDAVQMSGEPLEARKIYLRAFQLASEANAIPIALDALLGLARLQSQADRLEAAFELCVFIAGHPASDAETRVQAERLGAQLAAQLDPTRSAAARARTRGASLNTIFEVVSS